MGRLRLGGGFSCVSLALDCKVLVLGVNDRFNKYSDKQIYTDVLSPRLFAGEYCNKMSRVVFFGPNKLGGMEWDNPVVVYQYERIKILIASMSLQDTVGRLMWI